MKKSVLRTCILTALSSLLCLSAIAAAPSDWAKDSYTKAASLDLAVEEDKTVEDATRLDFCRLAYDTVATLRTVPSAASCPFTDTDEKSVAVLYALGVVRGKDETHFCPNDSITREEAAVLLWRMLNAAGVENVAEERTFTDMDEVSDWAKTAVSSIPASLMQGVGADRFAPCEPYTYEQCVTTLMRFLDIARAEKPDRYLSETMYKAMPTDQNYMFSPLSLKTALGLAAAGAEGETKEELLDFVCVPDEETLLNKTRSLLDDYDAENPLMQLSMANGIFYNISHTDQRFSPEYVKKAADLYNASAAEVTDDNAVQTVNDFAAEHTNGKITKIVDSPRDYEVLLMNALYFKGEWQTPFSKQATNKEPFTDRDGKQTETDFMHVIDRFAYASADGVQIVELPYKYSDYIETDDGYTLVTAPADVSMYLLMGDERVMNCEERIRTATLSRRRIRLSMPSFRMRNSFDLSSIPSLASLRAFDKDRAEFAPMVTKNEMWLDVVMQDTYIEVDETGTEAAAVTHLGKAGGTAVEEPPLEVTFDHPFTFVIFDKTHDEVLFMGEYVCVK